MTNLVSLAFKIAEILMALDDVQEYTYNIYYIYVCMYVRIYFV